MKKLVMALAAVALNAAVQAQQSTSYSPEVDLRERARIQAERQAAQESYGQEEAYCYQRFAVNDCLREVRKRKRVTLEELRRQEVILNDDRRAAAAAEKQRQADERAARQAGRRRREGQRQGPQLRQQPAAGREDGRHPAAPQLCGCE